MKQIYLFSSLLLSLFIIRETASAQVLEGRDFIPGQYLIQFDSRINVEKFQEKTAASRAGYEVEILGKESNIVTISYPTLTMDELTEYIRNLDGVVAFQKDYYLEERNKIPNDPLFTPNQWNMKIIKAPEAWDITTGGITPIGHEIVVGVLDGGFYVNHPDLIDNLFTNIAEIPGNGIDDDDNGFIDDIHGVNLDNNSGTHAEASHGTSVMGIIGAKGDNGQGVTGVNWNVKILPVSRAVANISALIRGYEYLLDFRKKFNASQGQEGAFIVATNLSAGQSHKFPIDQPIWCNMYETLGLSGIISAGATSNANEDVDEVGDLPSTCESEFLMIVTNTTSNDMLYTNSGYGFKSVDLGAPGEGCTSTTTPDGYGSFGGTSCSTPHVAGAVAFMYSVPNSGLENTYLNYPVQSARAVRAAILANVDIISDLIGKTVTGGRLNLFRMATKYVSSNNKLNISGFSVFPNPVIDLVQVDLGNRISDSYNVEIINSRGESKMTGKYQVNGDLFNFNLPDLTPGIYFIKIMAGNFNGVGKFVKL